MIANKTLEKVNKEWERHSFSADSERFSLDLEWYHGLKKIPKMDDLRSLWI